MASECFNAAKYLPTSFKGISFLAEAVVTNGGRRGASGEFLYSNAIEYVDLGKKQNSYLVQGFFEGEKHLEYMRALFMVCNDTNPGLFIHPVLGRVRAACTDIKWTTKTKSEFNISRFTLSFIEAPQPTTYSDFLTDFINADYRNLTDDVLQMFNSRFSTADVNKFIIEDTQTKILDFIKLMQNNFATFADSNIKYDLMNKLEFGIQHPEVAEDSNQITNFIGNILTHIDNDIPIIGNQITTYENILNYTAKDNDFSNPLKNVFYSSIRLISTIKLSEIYQKYYADNSYQIVKAIDLINSLFTNEINILKTYSDVVFIKKAEQYKTNVINDLMRLSQNSTQPVKYQFNSAVPAIYAAWNIYGDSTKVDLLRKMNYSRGIQIGEKVEAWH